MTEQECRKIDEVYQKIINLLAQEGLTYKQVRNIYGQLGTHLDRKGQDFLNKSSAKEVLF